ncbi:MAG TPA: hypothetical protein VGK67_40020 [Myxococcales bacterium]
MTEKKTRRSFLSDVLIRAAGGVLLLSGFGSSGCGTPTTKYGGPPEEDAGTTVAKYGGPVEDAGMVAKYGGPPVDAGVEDDAGVVVKYGGPPDAGV